MNDYKELIEDLMALAEHLSLYKSENVPYTEYAIEDVEAAADAIEQLVKERDNYCCNCGAKMIEVNE